MEVWGKKASQINKKEAETRLLKQEKVEWR